MLSLLDARVFISVLGGSVALPALLYAVQSPTFLQQPPQPLAPVLRALLALRRALPRDKVLQLALCELVPKIDVDMLATIVQHCLQRTGLQFEQALFEASFKRLLGQSSPNSGSAVLQHALQAMLYSVTSSSGCAAALGSLRVLAHLVQHDAALASCLALSAHILVSISLISTLPSVSASSTRSLILILTSTAASSRDPQAALRSLSSAAQRLLRAGRRRVGQRSLGGGGVECSDALA